MFPDLWDAVTWFVTLPGVQAIVLIVTAVATASSVIVALVISRRAEARQIAADRRQAQRDDIEAEARLERRAERQAAQVTVEMEYADGPGSRLMTVWNASPYAITHVRVSLMIGEPKADGTQYESRPSAEGETIVPHRTRTDFNGSTGPYDPTRVSMYPEVDFTDAFGDSWRLTPWSLTQTWEKYLRKQIERA